MALWSRTELQKLMNAPNSTYVSLYLPTQQAGASIQQNPIRFKNLLNLAEQKLTEYGHKKSFIEELLAPAYKLLPDRPFWQNQGLGLAVFMGPELFRYYRVPHPLPELTVVAPHMHLKPLLPLLTSDGRFYVLAVSQSKVRFFEATRDYVEEIPLTDFPEGLASVIQDYERSKELQFHTGAPAHGAGKRAAIFHGHGTEVDPKPYISKYFRQVNSNLKELLDFEDHAPLVLAAVDYLHPIYKEANTYPHLIKQGILGNPDNLSPQELHAKAWTLVQPQFQAIFQEAAQKYRNLMGTGLTANAIEEILPAVARGRIEYLFVTPENDIWGSFEEDQERVQIQDEPSPSSVELLDLAAVKALLRGGTTFTVPKTKMPDDSVVAATYRF